MDVDSLAGLGGPAYRGTTDPDLTDFTGGANPRRPSGVAGVFESALSAARRHPADDYVEFRTAAAEHLGCEPRQVLPCSGEFNGVRLVADLVIEPGDSVLVQTPGCAEYPKEVTLQGATPVSVPHRELLDSDPSGHDAVILCHPNAKMGPTYETGDLVDFVERCADADTTVIVDETYLDLSGRATLSGLPGVVAVRSLGEAYGLPGLRMGVVIATGELREQLEVARTAWGLSVPGAVVGRYCLEQESFLAESRERIADERERLRRRLETRYEVVNASAVYLCIEVGDADATALTADAREAGLVISNGRQYDGLDNHVVFSIRRREANDALLEVLGV